jgi:hypothetical protein
MHPMTKKTTTEALGDIADALHRLGIGNATTDKGAIEGHTMEMRTAMQLAAETIADGLYDVAEAIREIKKTWED